MAVQGYQRSGLCGIAKAALYFFEATAPPEVPLEVRGFG
jgi:hypothetical protein